MNCLRLLGAVAVASLALGAMAMPSRNDLKKVQAAVNELMADDMKAVKSGKMKQTEAADHAVGYAREATDEASKFLFYKGAFGLYVKGQAYSEALKALDLLKGEVKDVPDKVLVEIIGGKMKDVPREDGGALVALYESLNRKLRCEDECRRLEGALKSNPKNAEARRQLAVCRAQLGDWTAATKEFAQLEGAEGKAAKQEQAGELKAAADGWWDLAANAEEDDQTLFRRHAADLYRKAIDAGKVTGIQKSLAQKRADDYPAEGAKVATTTSPSPAEGRAASSGDGGAVAERNAPRAVVKPGKGITLKLKKGVPLEFVHCPAGTYTKGICYAPDGSPGGRTVDSPHKVTISRAFYMTCTPVTCEQYWTDVWSRKWSELPSKGSPRIDQLLFPELGFKNGTAAAVVGEGGLGPQLQRAEDVVSWAAELTKRYARDIPRGYVIRLPTEAEYEYAVRAGSDNAEDSFVKPCLTEDEKGQLSVRSRVDLAPICEKKGLLADIVIKNLLYGTAGYPAPVGSRRANAWGISDGWNYLLRILLADRWIPGKSVPYSVLAAPMPVSDGAVDPVYVVPSNIQAGNVVLGVAFDSWLIPRGSRCLTLRVDGNVGSIRPGYFGYGQTGFFLVIAPDLSTLTAITPPKE